MEELMIEDYMDYIDIDYRDLDLNPSPGMYIYQDQYNSINGDPNCMTGGAIYLGEGLYIHPDGTIGED